MVPPDEMASMQRRLDEDRAALPALRLLIEKNFTADAGGGRLRFPELVAVCRDLDMLIELDGYRERLVGGPGGDERSYGRFGLLRRSEELIRDRVSVRLGHLAECAEQGARQEVARRLEEELFAFSSLPERERDLYRARRDWARLILDNTKSVISFGAANQILDIASSGGQSVQMIRLVQGNRYALPLPPGNVSLKIGQRAALSEHFRTGNCTEQAYYAATEAFRMLPGTEISVMNHRPHHAYAVIGPPGFPEAAYADPWPRRATVTNCDGYGLRTIEATSIAFRDVADGRNLRDEAMPYIQQLPDRPSPVPPIAFEDAVQAVRRVGAADRVFHIVRTTDQANSDSDPDEPPLQGHTLSEGAFSATAAPVESLTRQARSGPVTGRRAADARPGTESSGPAPAGLRPSGAAPANSPARARTRGR
ncbi:hypothetical protein [Streptomyces globisporus]|uniref:hypothetical protein n=1 Tax=Streptomyces globisporus TaxID=1908 RepID=UPI003807E3EE